MMIRKEMKCSFKQGNHKEKNDDDENNNHIMIYHTTK